MQRSGPAGARAREKPAALVFWSLLSRPQGRPVAFRPAHPLSLTLSLSLLQGFVLAVTIIREAVEEIRCYMRDKEVNSQVYSRLTARGQPPAAQPQGVAGGVGIGSQLGHGPLTFREQSSQPRAVGCGRLGRDSRSVAERLREARVCPGPGGTLATSLGHHCAPGACADG